MMDWIDTEFHAGLAPRACHNSGRWPTTPRARAAGSRRSRRAATRRPGSTRPSGWRRSPRRRSRRSRRRPRRSGGRRPASRPRSRRAAPPRSGASSLGITGLALLLLSLGTLFFITLPLLVRGLGARPGARARRARPAIGGEGQATAALWLGRIGVIAGVAAAVVLIALVAAGFDFEELRRDLERELERRRAGRRRRQRHDGVRIGRRGAAGRHRPLSHGMTPLLSPLPAPTLPSP